MILMPSLEQELLAWSQVYLVAARFFHCTKYHLPSYSTFVTLGLQFEDGALVGTGAGAGVEVEAGAGAGVGAGVGAGAGAGAVELVGALPLEK